MQPLALVRTLTVSFLLIPLAHAAPQCPSWQDLGANIGFSPPFNQTPSIYPQAAVVATLNGTSALYAAGNFIDAGASGAANIARWDGSSWSALGASSNGRINDLCAFDDGGGPALFAAGQFSTIGGVSANAVARWDGSSWQSIGMSSGSWGLALASGDIGTGSALYISGGPGVMRWNGTQLTTLSGPLSWTPTKLLIADLGSGPALFAIRWYTGFGGTVYYAVARWTGSAWVDLCNSFTFGQRINTLGTLRSSSGNVLCIGGSFTNLNGFSATNLATWNGTNLGTLGSGPQNEVMSLAEFDAGTGSGPVLIAGEQTGATLEAAASWSGAQWNGIGSYIGLGGSVCALAAFDDHSGAGPALYALGGFVSIDNSVSNDIALWRGCNQTGIPVCPGDGSLGACPCANSGAAGRGCENSASTGGARLDASGLASLAQDTLAFSASGELPTALSIFLQGTQSIAPASFGDGLRCTGGTLRRLYAHNASSGSVAAPLPGDLSVSARSSTLGDPLQGGTTRFYQTYYRDASSSFCPAPQGNTWNVSSGVRVDWQL